MYDPRRDFSILKYLLSNGSRTLYVKSSICEEKYLVMDNRNDWIYVYEFEDYAAARKFYLEEV